MADLSARPGLEYARSREAWTDLDWWTLEARALTNEKKVRASLAVFAPLPARRPLAHGIPWLGCLLAPLSIAALTFPVLAAFLLMGWVFSPSTRAAVGVAGLMAGFAAVWDAGGTILTWRRPEGPPLNGGLTISLLHLVPSTVATLVAVLAIAREDAAGAIGLVGLVADVVVGAVSAWIYRPRPNPARIDLLQAAAQLRRTVDAVPALRQRRALADIRAAVDDLDGRGLISSADADRARQAPFGGLGLLLAPQQDDGASESRAADGQ